MSTEGCTCWLFPTEQGETMPLTWACLHDEVCVITKDGSTVVGWGLAGEVLHADGVRKPMLQIEDDAGVLYFLRPEEIASVTPVELTPDESAFARAVTEVISRAKRGGPQEHMRLVVGQHRTVEVEVRHARHACSPHGQTRPMFEI
ncbi:hypothetical protein [Nocardioides jejuensis]|uniref:Uncharacterized protein n=1 Tax=Nocardioides jejuensis TaxID=2502782 RepID=A0A4R1BV72_9ACTN|nr:hypothetical protein [Nocardioides jejuensis]TCJ21651.1 hypothetical protein EPD65_14585 [Nocardioides jejuensis]